MFTLGELAERLNLAFTGDKQRQLTGLASLASARRQDLSFHEGKRHLGALADTRAGAVVLHPQYLDSCPTDCLLTNDPYLTYARVSGLFVAAADAASGCHPSAIVAADAQVHTSAVIGPGAVIESDVQLGPGVRVGAGVVIGRGSRLGSNTRVYPGAVIAHDVHMGDNCTIHAGAVIGADGFGFASGPDGWEKIHQLGGVRIGDRVEVGACSSIDRGALDHTEIADGVIIDNQVQIGHNCRIGAGTAIAGCCGLAGSTVIGANCTLAGGVGVVGHVEICDNVHVTGMSMVTRSITRAGSYSSGTPMAATAQWKRNAVRFGQLDTMAQRLSQLHKAAHTHPGDGTDSGDNTND